MFPASDQEQNRWENDTVSASPAKTEGKGKDEPVEPDSQSRGKSWPVKQLLPTTVCKKITWNQFLVGFVTQMWLVLENVSARSGLGSCWIVSCQREDCLSRTLHFSNHNFLSAFAVVTSWSRSPRVRSRRFPFPCLRKRFFPVFGISQGVRIIKECECALAKAFKKQKTKTWTKIIQSLLTLLREQQKSDLAKDLSRQEQHLSSFCC